MLTAANDARLLRVLAALTLAGLALIALGHFINPKER